VPLVEFNDSLEMLHGRGYIRTDDETLGSADESPLSYTIQIRWPFTSSIMRRKRKRVG
jgi:hypothetical protein